MIRSYIVLAGIIGRAENQAMVKELKIKFVPLTKINFSDYKHIALVDTQPGLANNSFPRRLRPAIVIDHHPIKKINCANFVDIRPDYGACATILTEYLLNSEIKLPARICTALSYGISSETQELGREASPEDIKAYLNLFPKSALKTLSRIKNPALSNQYYLELDKALHNAFVYRNIMGTKLGKVSQPDIVSQIADMLLKKERITWSVCIGRFEDKLIISVRTQNKKAQAGRLLKRVLAVHKGSAGGHGMIAGGQIDCSNLSYDDYKILEDQIIKKFFKVLGFNENIQVKPFLSTVASTLD